MTEAMFLFRTMAIVFAALLAVVACSTSSHGDAEPPGETQQATAGAEVTDAPEADSEESAHRFVQDLWVYERLSTIDADGDEVDLTDVAVEGLDGPPDQEVELVDGVTFRVHESLDAKLTAADGTVREDLDVVAGLIEHEGDRAVSVLATPEPDAHSPVGFGDQVSIDLTYLDELAPGDPLFSDFAFLQPHPGDDDADASGLELLATRMAAERVGFFGEGDDGEPNVLLYSDEPGEAVEGSTRGRLPAKSRDMTDGMNKGLKGCRGTLRCVAKFFDKFGDGAKSSYEQALDNGNLRDRRQNRRHPACRGTNCARLWGDPHLLTFDGVGYDMQGVGEFIAVSSPDLEVQLRTRPYRHMKRISIGTAAAVGFGSHRVTVDTEVEPDEIVRIDGDPVPLDDLRAEPHQPDGATVSMVGNAVQIERDEDLITIANPEGGGFFDLYVDFGADFVETEGLLGSADGDGDNDFTTRDGDVLEQPLSHDALYDEFVESWRIAQDESLFDYADGTDTEHYTDRSFPAGPMTAADLDDGDRVRAEAVCRSAGIDDEGVLEDCMLDYGLTGEIGFVRSAVVAEIAQLIVDGDLDPTAMPIGGSGSGDAATREDVEVELTVEPYEPDPDEIAWLFTSDDGSPDQVPDGIEVTPIESPNDLEIFEFTDQDDHPTRYHYPTVPILRLSPFRGAWTPEEAVELGAFVEFDVKPTAGPVEISHVRLAAGRDRPGQSRRGVDVRSSADDYATSLLTADVEARRPDMERFSATISGLTITEPTTFRLYVYTGNRHHAVDLGDFAIGISR